MAHGGDARKGEEEEHFVGSPKDYEKQQNSKEALALMEAFMQRRNAEKRANATRAANSSTTSGSTPTTDPAP